MKSTPLRYHLPTRTTGEIKAATKVVNGVFSGTKVIELWDAMAEQRRLRELGQVDDSCLTLPPMTTTEAHDAMRRLLISYQRFGRFGAIRSFLDALTEGILAVETDALEGDLLAMGIDPDAET